MLRPIEKLSNIVRDLWKGRHTPTVQTPPPSPKTIEDAMRFLRTTELFRQMQGFVALHEIPMLHHTVGMQLRNHWGLWHGSELAQDFVKSFGLTHADDMSGYLLERLFADAHGKAFYGGKIAHKYQEHWRESTGRAIPPAEWLKDKEEIAPLWDSSGHIVARVIANAGN